MGLVGVVKAAAGIARLSQIGQVHNLSPVRLAAMGLQSLGVAQFPNHVPEDWPGAVSYLKQITGKRSPSLLAPFCAGLRLPSLRGITFHWSLLDHLDSGLLDADHHLVGIGEHRDVAG